MFNNLRFISEPELISYRVAFGACYIGTWCCKWNWSNDLIESIGKI